jgi:hypothetical protein
MTLESIPVGDLLVAMLSYLAPIVGAALAGYVCFELIHRGLVWARRSL